MELQEYRTHMDELVEERVRELDEAHERLAEESRERRATEEVLRRRVEELDVLTRMAQILAGRTTLERALEEATSATSGLFKARYVRVRLLTDGAAALEAAAGLGAAAPAAGDGRQAGGGEPQALSGLDLAVTDTAMGDCEMVAEDVADWPGLADAVRRQAQADGVGPILAEPLVASSGPAGALVIARDAGAESLHRRGAPAGAHHRRGARRGDRDRPALPPGDQRGGRGGAPGASARPARRGDAEHLQRHADRRGAARRVAA